MIHIPLSYVISILAAVLFTYHLINHNTTDTFNFVIILCIALCTALSNILTPHKQEPDET